MGVGDDEVEQSFKVSRGKPIDCKAIYFNASNECTGDFSRVTKKSTSVYNAALKGSHPHAACARWNE
jgi:hypothetical protein